MSGNAYYVFEILTSAAHRLIYRLMQKQIRQLEGFPEETDRLAADAIEDIEEGAPLLRDFSDESVNKVPTTRPPSPQLP